MSRFVMLMACVTLMLGSRLWSADAAQAAASAAPAVGVPVAPGLIAGQAAAGAGAAPGGDAQSRDRGTESMLGGLVMGGKDFVVRASQVCFGRGGPHPQVEVAEAFDLVPAGDARARMTTPTR